jgi:acyl carrier protein
MTDSLTTQIKEIIVRELNLQDHAPQDIADDVPLFGEGLGLDSLDALQLAVALEEAFGVKLPEGDDAREVCRNVASLAACIERARADSA